MPKRLRTVLAATSSLLIAVALPNDLLHWGSPIFGVVALAPLFVAIYHSPSYRNAAWLGVVFGGLSTVLTNFWLLFFQSFSVWTLGGVTLAYIGFGAVLAPFLRFVAAVPRRYRPFAVAAAWALYEYLKSSGYLGYPWGLIAYPVHALSALVQFTAITGVWGLSLLMALVNATVAEWLEWAMLGDRVRGGHRRHRLLPPRLWQGSAAVALLVLAAVGYGWWQLGRTIPAPGSADLVLVQHNRNPWLSGDVNGTLLTLQRLTDAAIAAAPQPPDLVVWSETALQFPLIGSERRLATQPPERPLGPYLRDLGVPLLTGLPWIRSTDPVEAMNAAALVDGGAVVQHYGKQHPVPFAESVPFWNVPFVRRFFIQVIGLQAVWVSGTEATIFSVPLRAGGRLRFGTPICFEDAFPALVRQFFRAPGGGPPADLLINLTNDAWSRTVSAETQHFVAAKFRAIENRRVLVRATNGGVTAVVDPWGRFIDAPAPLFTETALRITVPVYAPAVATVYTRYGDFLPAVLALVMATLLARNVWRSGRRGVAAGTVARTGPAGVTR